MSPTEIIMIAGAVHKAFDTRIFHKEAKTLSNAGYKVSLIIPHDKDELISGINIRAVSRPKSGFQQLFITPLKIFWKTLSFSRKSIIHIHDSELLVIGVLLRLSGRRVIYDAHEDTPRQLQYQHWIPILIKPFYILFYFLLERFCGILFNAIIVAEPVIGRHYPKRKTTLIRNFVISEFFRPVEINDESKKNQIIYIGLLSKPRGLFEMVEAMKLLPQELDIKLILGGKFAPAALENEIENIPKIEFIGWVPFEQIPGLLSVSKIGIITPLPYKRYLTNYPVKLFEYMASGLPVIASKFGESAKFVEEANCGLLVDPQRPEEICEAIIKLISNPDRAIKMGINGQKLIFEKYNWESESEKLIAVYKNLLK